MFPPKGRRLAERGAGQRPFLYAAVTTGFVGLSAIRAGAFPLAFGVASLVIGISGLLTIFPALQDIFGAIFGLGYIAWFIWIGFILLLDNRRAP